MKVGGGKRKEGMSTAYLEPDDCTKIGGPGKTTLNANGLGAGKVPCLKLKFA